MFPNRIRKNSLQHQRGFLLPLALFILVVMGALALTISRTSIQTQNSTLQEFTSIQAFYAAESGAQRGMQRLFLDTSNALTRAAVNARCTSWNENFTFAGVKGLSICNAQVNCGFTVDTNNTKSFYTITSVGNCGHQQFRAERTIQVGAYLEQE